MGLIFLALPVVLTVDTSGLTDGIQVLMDQLFPMLGTALLILAPIAAIGIAFAWAPNIINMFKKALGFGGK